MFLLQVVDGERFKFQVPELGIKTHTNTHKKIAYVVLKDQDMSYPNDEFFKSPDSSPESSELVVAPS